VLSTYSPRGAVPTDTTAITATIITRTEKDVDLVAESNMRTGGMSQKTGGASRSERIDQKIKSRLSSDSFCAGNSFLGF